MVTAGPIVRWGVLGTAKIATGKVIPAMQRCRHARVVAIGSRNGARARAAAAALGIDRPYASYDEVLADGGVDAVYIPLPNHQHVRWTLRALEADKHVLCEKPIGLTAAEARPLIAARDRTGRLVQEAFMIRSHPQWHAAIEAVRSGRLGEVTRVDGRFSYRNLDPANIRNQVALGGGGLLDIGCYLVHVARWVLDREPLGVTASLVRDPVMGIDAAGDFVLQFAGATATGTYGTQRDPEQRVEIQGSLATFAIEIPFNAPPDRPCHALLTPREGPPQPLTFDVCDQYTLQGDAVSQAILEQRPAPYPLEDSIANMAVIDAIFAAGDSRVH
jgi:predicted dehydrogenase